ncbi:hypothetical protein E2C01_085907 [Portunus trituberculatus]|uniref:Uncharacterized protein n=1 Tax=Portunus trituberculatus TaxID=210409 RepID=A0A5B7J8V4_PORTR|nr:hypothetical protein [Portunus trituberculatus]
MYDNNKPCPMQAALRRRLCRSQHNLCHRTLRDGQNNDYLDRNPLFISLKRCGCPSWDGVSAAFQGHSASRQMEPPLHALSFWDVRGIRQYLRGWWRAAQGVAVWRVCTSRKCPHGKKVNALSISVM